MRKPTIQKLLPGSRARRDRFGNELIEVQNLDVVFAQKLGKPIVLLLRRGKIRDVIEQQASHTVRREIEELPARSMEHDFFQPADFGPDMQAITHNSPWFIILAVLSPLWAFDTPRIKERPEGQKRARACRASK